MKTSYDYSNRIYPGAARRWAMSHAERCALLHILELNLPSSAIEIGTDAGGCLEQIRTRADFVYSIDINPDIAARLGPEMPNVEFLTGDSKELIGAALQRCAERSQPLGFVLIDGDHGYRAVQDDIHAVLRYEPARPLWILMHDSANPECRAGIAEAQWASNPHVHMVDLDFVSGTLSQDLLFEDMIWNGFAIALLQPERREGGLQIAASGSRNQALLYRHSIHYPSLANGIRRWMRIKRKGLRRRLDALKRRFNGHS